MLIFLISNKTNDSDIANNDVTTMATLGDQPTLNLYLNKERIFTWNKQPSPLQQIVVADKVIQSVYKQSYAITKEDIKEYLDKRYNEVLLNPDTSSDNNKKH